MILYSFASSFSDIFSRHASNVSRSFCTNQGSLVQCGEVSPLYLIEECCEFANQGKGRHVRNSTPYAAPDPWLHAILVVSTAVVRVKESRPTSANFGQLSTSLRGRLSATGVVSKCNILHSILSTRDHVRTLKFTGAEREVAFVH